MNLLERFVEDDLRGGHYAVSLFIATTILWILLELDDSSGWMLPFAMAATVLFAVGLAVAWVLSKVGPLREKAAGS